MSGPELILANAALLLGAVLQGAVGFGAMLLAVPILVLINPDLVPSAALIASFPLAVIVILRDGAHGTVGEVRWAVYGRFLGAPLGVAVLATVSESRIGLLFAVMLLAAVGLTAGRWEVTPTPRNGFVAGVASGISGTTVGVGGPPVALVYQHAEGPALRANMAWYFQIGLFISLGALIVGGELGWWDVGWGLAMMLGPTVGVLASSLVTPYLDAGRTRPAVLIVSAVAAGIVLVREVL